MLGNMSLKLKLLLLSAFSAVALLATIVTGGLGIRGGVQGVEELGGYRMPSLVSLEKLREHQIALRSSTYEAALWENDPEAQEMFDTIAKDKTRLWGQIDAETKNYEAMRKSPEETAVWREFLGELEKWRAADKGAIGLIVELAANKDFAHQKALFQRYYMEGGKQRQAYLAAMKVLEQAVDLNTKNARQVTEEAIQGTRLAEKVMLGVGILALAVSLAFAAWVTHGILRQMGGDPSEAMRVTQRIAEGDLTVPIVVGANDAGSLLASMERMRGQLRLLIGQVQRGASELAGSAKALTQDVAVVASNGMNENSAAKSAAEEVHHIARRIQDIGASADQARALSTLAGDLSGEGQNIMSKTVGEMDQVVGSVRQSSGLIHDLGIYSNQISNIVSVIKDIADQTNLLALNAAIEAARAGEQGRGFAVVADEVRKLAERTGKSTDEITSVIGTIQNGVANTVESMQGVSVQVENGVGLVRNASDSMLRIHSGAHDASQAVLHINSALKESTGHLDAIESQMSSIVNMVEANGGAVEKMAHSSRRLDQLALELASAAQCFKI
jgi:methyl-accepting chemotaxis protein